RHVGFVFQTFQLMPTLTALENVLVPIELSDEGGTASEDRTRASALLERVGLADRLGHYPAQLSGGEQQRVAIARAFANRPRILFADEPTGNLDAETGRGIIELLVHLNAEERATLVLVTHDLELAGRAHRVIRLAAGRLADAGTPAVRREA
ncbi:MAG TPA: ATP-binding cassette domain-containing protein, partial [Methylomirabilota bacterium]|nr:ATP-binding cassette domain-containing protein [Methylomirabilota bacterium]